MRKYLEYFVYFTLFIAFMLINYIAYLIFCPQKVIDFKSVTLMKDTYKRGEIFSMNISYCKYKQIPAQMTRQFINGVIFTLAPGGANSPTGCRINESRDIIIPKELEPGKYIYKQTMIYQVNPLRIETVEFQTKEFNVE